jgi:hypothetical protein
MSSTGEARRMRSPEDTVRKLCDVRALILLGGSLRTTPLMEAIGRSVLDLPLEKGLRILDHWCREASGLAEALGGADLDLRVVVDGTSALPEDRNSIEGITVSVERDPFEYRGTAGALSDLCADYDKDDVVVVANAGQLPLYPLVDQVAEMSAEEAEVALLSAMDGTPCGIWMLRCGVLEKVARVGFIDFKEQALPDIAKQHRVQVVHREKPSGPSLRTLDGYLRTLRSHHIAKESGTKVAWDPFAEDWQPAFSIVEDGAEVDPSAGIFDSVVLSGAKVAGKASVIRSVIGPRGALRRGTQVIRAALGGTGEDRRHHEAKGDR